MSSLSFPDVRLSYNPAAPLWRFREAGLDAVVFIFIFSASAIRRKDPDGTKDGGPIAVPPTTPATPTVTPEPEPATDAVRPAKSGFKLGRLPRSKPNTSSV
jgi:hypothetical protein